jgi:hypothetical protein
MHYSHGGEYEDEKFNGAISHKAVIFIALFYLYFYKN